MTGATKTKPWQVFYDSAQKMTPHGGDRHGYMTDYQSLFDQVPGGHILQIDLGINVFHKEANELRHAHHFFAHHNGTDYFWGVHDNETTINIESNGQKQKGDETSYCKNDGFDIRDAIFAFQREVCTLNSWRPIAGDTADVRPVISFWDIDPQTGTRTRL